jgi:hypothetical protein
MQEASHALRDLSESQIRRHIRAGRLTTNGELGDRLLITAESVGVLASQLRRRTKVGRRTSQTTVPREDQQPRMDDNPERPTAYAQVHRRRLELQPDEGE